VDDFVAALLPPVVVRGLPLSVKANFGIALFPHDGNTVADLLESADSAMYTAKYDGIPVYMARSSNDRRPGRRSTQLDIGRAIGQNELDLHYQPIVSIDGDLVAAEALVRWQHPERGLLLPGAFVPYIENTELLVQLTHFVISSAARAAVSWNAFGREIEVAVNASAQDFRDESFPSFVADTLHTTGLPPNLLTIELTDGALAADATGTAPHTAAALKALGVTLALDDFGTGYATLAVLRDMPFDIVKIDRSFVNRMGALGKDQIIIGTIMDLAKKLGLKVTAEGVEDHATWSALRRTRCDRIQGWVISKPIEADAIASFRLDAHATPVPAR
jgi:EAL domain-containing protein (putative c-di-GMP-specific phosphodiesterase class I)